MRHALILAIGLGALLLGAPARAEDNGACAKYEEPLAYNACLARFGPRAYEAGAVAAPAAEAGAAARGGAHRGPEISRGRRGRLRMEFDVAGKRGVRRQ
ncbi:MAG: hypothetical protein ABR878_17250 [Roseiarcus sp.]|jgi:hypothetical protein